MPDPYQVIDELAERLGGSRRDIAAVCGVHETAITKWNKRGVPAHLTLFLANLTGIKPERLCPRVFGKAARRP
jgi:hypothetical protein